MRKHLLYGLDVLLMRPCWRYVGVFDYNNTTHTSAWMSRGGAYLAAETFILLGVVLRIEYRHKPFFPPPDRSPEVWLP
jgi:hypothetical protein